MDQNERARLIDQYKRGYATILASIADMTDEEWDAREAPGEWSPREVIHHLADSEMTSAIRIRRLIVEDAPLIQGYDQEAFTARLYYDRPIETSLLALEGARVSTSALLDCMTEEDWQSAGTHSESGDFSADDWLRAYAVHCDEHADQIMRARAALTP
ncbi:MAG: DinB family protein [Thermomicrobiales bacterium]